MDIFCNYITLTYKMFSVFKYLNNTTAFFFFVLLLLFSYVWIREKKACLMWTAKEMYVQ